MNDFLDERKEGEVIDPLERLLHLLVGKEKAIENVLKLIEISDQKGLLTMANYLVNDGTDLVDTGISFLATPTAFKLRDQGMAGLKILENALLLMNKMEANLSASEQEITIKGLWDIVKVMRDPDVSRGISKVFSLLKAFGASYD
jgi:uncharacterized protein YjgD (DUF1641 family)